MFGAVQEAKRSGIPVARSHSSSMKALETILNERRSLQKNRYDQEL